MSPESIEYQNKEEINAHSIVIQFFSSRVVKISSVWPQLLI